MAVGFTLALPVATTADAGFCGMDRIHQRHEVQEVVDGDTIRLTNGRTIRLIGVNTPELNPDSGSPEPLATTAKGRLQQLIGANPVLLRYDREREDRHHRLLAHVFGIHGENLTEQLIEEGLGFHITIPPNDWQWACYQNAEQRARRRHLNVWGIPYYAPQAATSLHQKNSGFMLVTGRVTSSRSLSSGITITLDDRIRLFLRHGAARHFTELRGKPLSGVRVTARGWLYPRKGMPSMTIHHPSALTW